MGSNGLCNFFSCFKGSNHSSQNQKQLVFAETEPALDETLGHSFCYVRSSGRFLSPSHSDRIVSPSNSLRFSPSHRSDFPETAFKAISGASVSANSSIPKTVLQLDDDSTVAVNGFKGTSSFSALPLQPVPRGAEERERRAFFLSGPIESGALSGPLDDAVSSGSGVPFSAPLGGSVYVKKKKRKKSIVGLKKAFQRSLSEKKRPWVVPVGRKGKTTETKNDNENQNESESNVQWALGKAGEDRVHVVVSEEQGWLFVGIYDGFNGPDAPEFLMGNLYRAVHKELQGLFWELEDPQEQEQEQESNSAPAVKEKDDEPRNEESNSLQGSVKRVTFQAEGTESRRRRLWEFLAEDDDDDAEDGLDLSGSDRFAFSVDDALTVSKEGGSGGSKRWLILSKLKHGLSRHKEGHGRGLWPRSLGAGLEEEKEHVEAENPVMVTAEDNCRGGRKRKVGPVDHELVLSALSRALEMTELAYLDMTDKLIDTNPELALMGSCLLVVLMRDDDVYVMNVGDSRAIVAHYECKEVDASKETGSSGENIGSSGESIVEESLALDEGGEDLRNKGPAQERRLVALQLSTDHSTSIEEASLSLSISATYPSLVFALRQ